mgnify:FL=1
MNEEEQNEIVEDNTGGGEAVAPVEPVVNEEMTADLERLREENEQLKVVQESTQILMDPQVGGEYKKDAARRLLTSQGHDPTQIEEWVQIYDESPTTEHTIDSDIEDIDMTELQPESEDLVAREKAQQLEEQLNQMRARNLKESMEKEISSAMTSHSDLKMLKEWITSTRNGEDLNPVFDNISENVRQSALENLRAKRNTHGKFDETWLDEAVKTAATKVAKDMLSVIGDTSKIGRVPETVGQTETLSRRKPVELPSSKGKSYGDVEGQLRDWTSDQILRSLSDPGGDSKA